MSNQPPAATPLPGETSNTVGANRKPRRLPGEIAFDRCFLPLVGLIIFSINFQVILRKLSPSLLHTEEQLAAALPAPSWPVWVWFAAGVVLALLWIRAVVTLTKAWHDSSSRILRFSAFVLLFPFAVCTYQLLVAPFR